MDTVANNATTFHTSDNIFAEIIAAKKRIEAVCPECNKVVYARPCPAWDCDKHKQCGGRMYKIRDRGLFCERCHSTWPWDFIKDWGTFYLIDLGKTGHFTVR